MRGAIPAVTFFAAFVAAVCPFAASAACPTVTPYVEAARPATGEVGVPINGVVNFGTAPTFGGYSPVVTMSSGGSGTVSGFLIAGPAGAWTFRPDAVLQTNSTYSWQITDAAGVGSSLTGTFTTGTASDLTDPSATAAPTLTIAGYVPPIHTATCEAPGYYEVAATWPSATDDSPLLYVADVTIVDTNPDPGQLFTSAPTTKLASIGNQVIIKTPGYTQVSVSIHAIDEAGRESNSDIGTINIPAEPGGGRRTAGCGCDLRSRASRTIPASIALVLGLGALLLAARLRSRHDAI